MSTTAFDNPFTRLPDSQTRLLGVIGHPVAHSLSPAIHNPALAWLGLNMRYLAFPVHPDQLATAVRGFVAMGMLGFNATVPHKEALLPLMDHLEPLAQRIGAVNTVRIDEQGKLHGYNTDAPGFVDSLMESHPLDLPTSNVLLLGAGGAARGVVAGLLEAGCQRITVANRTPARAQQLLHDLAAHYPAAALQAAPLQEELLPMGDYDLLINTTLLGLHGDPSLPLSPQRLPSRAVVCDIVYNPPETPLLQAARLQGLATLNGLGMLLQQASRAFTLWTGQPMPIVEVRQRLLGLL
ncbi:shikimate dehydrogenase [Candidatus Magnetaquicoccus inordinatus]|uniref:shikimate dehydrogenase n=1 Tax=Candidatus Magnetaquicoccus inordinatus TaxID=2496818 RepID=UPI00102BA608|nr:shikimate dehydrogenase [Candidatus Magnetaquicoccus inordinatus]